jgi:choline dehydrogenase-like flavoprotein
MGYLALRPPRAVITRDYNGRPACHYCGRCGHGCDTGSKFTSVGALLPHAQATGRMTLFTNSIVREVMLDRGGRASGFVFIDRYTYQEDSVRGRYVVLAASAIETARLLLNSKSSRFPDCLANSSGQAGRHLVEDQKGFINGYLPRLAGRASVNEDGYGRDVMIHPFANVDNKSRRKDFLRRYQMYLGGGFSMSAGGLAEGPFSGENSKKTCAAGREPVSIVGAGCGLEITSSTSTRSLL